MGKLHKLTDQESIDLFENVINCIKKQKKGFFTFEKLRGVHGWCDWENGIILDYRKDLIPTIIHECIHFLNPEWSETQVCYAEKRVVSSVTPDDMIKLLMFFVKKL